MLLTDSRVALFFNILYEAIESTKKGWVMILHFVSTSPQRSSHLGSRETSVRASPPSYWPGGRVIYWGVMSSQKQEWGAYYMLLCASERLGMRRSIVSKSPNTLSPRSRDLRVVPSLTSVSRLLNVLAQLGAQGPAQGTWFQELLRQMSGKRTFLPFGPWLPTTPA